MGPCLFHMMVHRGPSITHINKSYWPHPKTLCKTHLDPIFKPNTMPMWDPLILLYNMVPTWGPCIIHIEKDINNSHRPYENPFGTLVCLLCRCGGGRRGGCLHALYLVNGKQ